MIRAATLATLERRPDRPKARRTPRESYFMVVACPHDINARGVDEGPAFKIGNVFKLSEVAMGLAHDGHSCVWPEGMQFGRLGRVYTVRGGRLVNEAGGLVTLSMGRDFRVR